LQLAQNLLGPCAITQDGVGKTDGRSIPGKIIERRSFLKFRSGLRPIFFERAPARNVMSEGTIGFNSRVLRICVVASS
jgi:hypothetical protein